MILPGIPWVQSSNNRGKVWLKIKLMILYTVWEPF